MGGGESPSLPGLLAEDEIELAGAAVGALPAGTSPLLGEELRAGDEIVLVASSGLHANGASLARMLAVGLDDGYATPLEDSSSFGAALLAPSVMYVALVQRLLEEGTPIRYLSHITGHGFLKLMRPRRELTYRIERLPPVPPVLSFMVERAGLDARAAYSTFNMGAGFTVYCAAGRGEEVARLAGELGLTALVAGVVEKGPRRVMIESVGVVYEGTELELSA